MHYRVRYLLDFDLKSRSGQGWIRQEYLSYSLTNAIPSWLVCAEIEVDNGPVQEVTKPFLNQKTRLAVRNSQICPLLCMPCVCRSIISSQKFNFVIHYIREHSNIT